LVPDELPIILESRVNQSQINSEVERARETLTVRSFARHVS
jgi:hypothetical protein